MSGHGWAYYRPTTADGEPARFCAHCGKVNRGQPRVCGGFGCRRSLRQHPDDRPVQATPAPLTPIQRRERNREAELTAARRQRERWIGRMTAAGLQVRRWSAVCARLEKLLDPARPKRTGPPPRRKVKRAVLAD